MGWVVNATPRPLYPRERPGTHFIGGWMGLRACLGTIALLRWKWVWGIDGTVRTREKWSNGQNAFPVPFCPPQIPHRPRWCRVRNAAMREACIWHPGQWHELKYVSSFYVFCVRYVNTWQTSHPGSPWKAAGAKGWQPYHLHVPTVLKSGSLNLLEPSGPLQKWLHLLPSLLHVPYNLLAMQVM
jgi:hypothetical protein